MQYFWLNLKFVSIIIFDWQHFGRLAFRDPAVSAFDTVFYILNIKIKDYSQQILYSLISNSSFIFSTVIPVTLPFPSCLPSFQYPSSIRPKLLTLMPIPLRELVAGLNWPTYT